MTRILVLSLAVFPAAGCGTAAPDPKPICTHLDEIVHANEAEWAGMDKCIQVLSHVPTKNMEEWAKDVRCLGDAKDQRTARKCSVMLSTRLRLDHPDADKAGIE